MYGWLLPFPALNPESVPSLIYLKNLMIKFPDSSPTAKALGTALLAQGLEGKKSVSPIRLPAYLI